MYQGHRNRNAWNVSLWIHNDEPLYRFAIECRRAARNATEAARMFVDNLPDRDDTKTPDGFRYRFAYVRSAIAGLE